MNQKKLYWLSSMAIALLVLAVLGSIFTNRKKPKEALSEQSEQSVDEEMRRIFVASFSSAKECAEPKVWIVKFKNGFIYEDIGQGPPNGYEEVIEKIKEDFSDATFWFYDLTLYVGINHEKEEEEVLNIEWRQHYSNGSYYEIIGIPTIANADKVIKDVLVAWTKAEHPVASLLPVKKTPVPIFKSF